MYIKSVKRSSVFAEDEFVSAEHIDMQIKFQSLTEIQLQWLWNEVRREFILDFEKDYILKVCVNEKRIKLSVIEQIILPKLEENSIWLRGVFHDERYKKGKSLSGAEKYADARWDKFDASEREEEKIDIYTFKNRDKFENDEAFLKHIRTIMNKERVPVMNPCVFPDIDWEFQYKKEGELYSGELMWSLAGCALEYDYVEVSEQLYDFIQKLEKNIPELIGIIYLISGKYSGIGPAFCEEMRGDIYDKYGKWPEDIFLLESVEWLNYVPYSLLGDDVKKKVEEDQRVELINGLNGRFYVIKKPICEVRIEDKKYMRRKYLDPYLMKARAILDEDIGEDSVIRSDGEEYPIFDEELQLCVKEDTDGKTVYGVQYVPIEVESFSCN